MDGGSSGSGAFFATALRPRPNHATPDLLQPQVQGVLSAAAGRWPHVHISDSLVMADAAVKMAEAGCRAVAVLGVDFMSENVRAILDEAGHTDVEVGLGGGCWVGWVGRVSLAGWLVG